MRESHTPSCTTIDAEMYGVIPSVKMAARKRTTRKHIEQAQDAPLLVIDHALERFRIDARHRDVRTNPINDQAKIRNTSLRVPVTELSISASCCALVATRDTSLGLCSCFAFAGPSSGSYEPPAASMAARAPAVAPIPFNLDLRVISPDLITLTTLVISGTNQPASGPTSTSSTAKAIQLGQGDFGVEPSGTT